LKRKRGRTTISRRFDLIIFDCDGVLVDSEPLANRILSERLAACGLTLSPEEVMRRFLGRTKAGCLELATELLGKPVPDRFVEDWDTALFAALAAEVKVIEGVAELLPNLGIPYCVASNSTPERMHLSLRTTGLLPLFEGRMFTAVEVGRPKPAPDLFLHAALSMGAAPSKCAVIEDTPTGARAGIAAGMTVFGYAGGAHTDVATLECEGAQTFTSMRDLPALLGRGKPPHRPSD
jgi:HAD superfamily hydrolase (TIGR01509 family)